MAEPSILLFFSPGISSYIMVGESSSAAIEWSVSALWPSSLSVHHLSD